MLLFSVHAAIERLQKESNLSYIIGLHHNEDQGIKFNHCFNFLYDYSDEVPKSIKQC